MTQNKWRIIVGERKPITPSTPIEGWILQQKKTLLHNSYMLEGHYSLTIIKFCLTVYVITHFVLLQVHCVLFAIKKTIEETT